MKRILFIASFLASAICNAQIHYDSTWNMQYVNVVPYVCDNKGHTANRIYVNVINGQITAEYHGPVYLDSTGNISESGRLWQQPWGYFEYMIGKDYTDRDTTMPHIFLWLADPSKLNLTITE